MTTPPGIFCLEGEWGDDLDDRTSVLPQLQMLENMQVCGRVIHRTAVTRTEFDHYVGRWAQRRYRRFKIAYLACHGGPGRLLLGKDEVTLENLAEVMEGKAEGRIMYFGSCSTMLSADDDLRALCKRSGAEAVVGYTRQVDWLEAAAFDFLLLPRLLDARYMKPVYTGLIRDHPEFASRLGLRVATKSWVTDRTIAVAASRAV